jgi:peptide deformylase
MTITKDLAYLRQKSTDIESVEEAKNIIPKLDEALINAPTGMGVAAIQIGIPKRISVFYNAKKEKKYLINPEIIEKLEEFVFYNEGCLSMPGYFQNTKRHRSIVLKNKVIDGDKFREEQCYFYYDKDNSTNYEAITIQHEIDHFNSVLLTDYRVLNIPVVTKEGKIGRNELCSCGSKKKYKKCCGKN